MWNPGAPCFVSPPAASSDLLISSFHQLAHMQALGVLLQKKSSSLQIFSFSNRWKHRRGVKKAIIYFFIFYFILQTIKSSANLLVYRSNACWEEDKPLSCALLSVFPGFIKDGHQQRMWASGFSFFFPSQLQTGCNKIVMIFIRWSQI